MNDNHSANWRIRIGFVLAAFIGLGWGILLGWYQVRLNAYLLAWLTLLVTMPLAFWGSVVTGFAFNRMLQAWNKLAVLLITLFIVAAGVPFGIIWGLLGDGVEPINLINSTGPHTWNLEWAIAIAGLVGGMFPRWMLPFLRGLKNLALWVLSGPASILRAIGIATLNFFNAIVNALTWLPRKLFQRESRPAQNVTTPRESLAPTPPPAPPIIDVPPQPRRTPRRSISRRVKSARRKTALAPENGNHNGARIVSTVEDRCPYCFDIVKKNDPRGVKKCEICGTPHHADCWAITGKCQVPHLNT